MEEEQPFVLSYSTFQNKMRHLCPQASVSSLLVSQLYPRQRISKVGHTQLFSSWALSALLHSWDCLVRK